MENNEKQVVNLFRISDIRGDIYSFTADDIQCLTGGEKACLKLKSTSDWIYLDESVERLIYKLSAYGVRVVNL